MVWLPTFNIRLGKFIDGGYRFRKNNFKKLDHWLPGLSISLTTFFDVYFFNSDEFNVDEKTALNKIGQIFFRIDSNEVNHLRRVYMLVDMLGEIGGLNAALTAMVMAGLGYYLTFSTDINYMMYMYSNKALLHKNIIDADSVEDEQQGQFPRDEPVEPGW